MVQGAHYFLAFQKNMHFEGENNFHEGSTVEVSFSRKLYYPASSPGSAAFQKVT